MLFLSPVLGGMLYQGQEEERQHPDINNNVFFHALILRIEHIVSPLHERKEQRLKHMQKNNLKQNEARALVHNQQTKELN